MSEQQQSSSSSAAATSVEVTPTSVSVSCLPSFAVSKEEGLVAIGVGENIYIMDKR